MGDARRGNREVDLNSWLPITASRKAKWWYSAFHCVTGLTAMVGAGVLGLPLVLARLGWIPGIIAIGVSWLATWYTVWLLVQLHEAESGKRFDRFAELGQHAFGEYLGFWLVIPQQIIVQVGSDVVYMVTGGKSLHKSLTLITPKADLRKTYYILMFAGVQLILSQTPNFNSLKIVSLLAAIMSISYSCIATGASLWRGFTGDHVVHYGFRSTSTVKIVFDIFSSLGVLAFAFASHSVALEIQATIPSSLGNPSRKPMARGVAVAHVIVALCYFPVAISGFWAFGNAVEDNVLVSLEHPHWLVSAANFMLFVHVTGSYQVFAMPMFDKIESTLVTRWHLTPGLPLRLAARTTYVVFTAFVGVLLPFFGGLLGFLGGLAFTSSSYIMPCAVWLKTQKPKPWSVHWILCRISILIGVTIMALAPIGGAHEIVNSWKIKRKRNRKRRDKHTETHTHTQFLVPPKEKEEQRLQPPHIFKCIPQRFLPQTLRQLAEYLTTPPPKKSIKSFAIAQNPPSSLVESRLWATVPVYRGDYYKNVVSCKRNRLHVRNSVNQEREAQISQEKEALGNGGGGPSTSLLSFLCPLLKLFSAGDPSAERNYLIEEATSSLSTLARLPWGSRSLSDGLNIEQRAELLLPLQLYEFEACPFCRRVRESITELDLSVEIFPCPKGSVRHRAMVRQLGGREQFPFLVDPNTGTSIYESSDIVKYLFQQYGGNRSPSFGIMESTLVTGWVPTLLRAGRGMTFWEDSIKESPPQKLELFSYENNPYARIVREALCELEIPYILQSVGEGSKRERLLNEISGSKEVPYLVDHNTGMKIGDYKKIVSYLFETYSSKKVAAYLQQ